MQLIIIFLQVSLLMQSLKTGYSIPIDDYKAFGTVGLASRQSNFIDPSTNIEYEYVSKHDDYYIYKLNLRMNFTEEQLDRTNYWIEKYLQESFNTPNRSYAYVILYCGTTTFASFHRDASLTLEQISGLLLARLEPDVNAFYICYLSVLERHRQRGLGTKLMQVLINEAIERTRFLVLLHVNTENRGAFSLYEKCGMRCINYIPNFYLGDDLYATQNAFTMILNTNNVKNSTSVCFSSLAVEIPEEEKMVFQTECPQAVTG